MINKLWCVAKNGLVEPYEVDIIKETPKTYMIFSGIKQRIYKDDYGGYNEYCDYFIEEEKARKHYENIIWQQDFGNIKRTDTLRLPSWEEIQKRLEADIFFHVCSFDAILMFVSDMRIIINNYGYITLEKVYNEKLTKENYINACEICKKLFLGESK